MAYAKKLKLGFRVADLDQAEKTTVIPEVGKRTMWTHVYICSCGTPLQSRTYTVGGCAISYTRKTGICREGDGEIRGM